MLCLLKQVHSIAKIICVYVWGVSVSVCANTFALRQSKTSPGLFLMSPENAWIRLSRGLNHRRVFFLNRGVHTEDCFQEVLCGGTDENCYHPACGITLRRGNRYDLKIKYKHWLFAKNIPMELQRPVSPGCRCGPVQQAQRSARMKQPLCACLCTQGTLGLKVQV